MNQLVLCVKFLVAALPVAVGFIYGLLFGLPVLFVQVISTVQETQERVLMKHTGAHCSPYLPAHAFGKYQK